MLKMIKDKGQIPEMLQSFWMAFLNVAIICCSLRHQLVYGQFFQHIFHSFNLNEIFLMFLFLEVVYIPNLYSKSERSGDRRFQ